MYIKEALNTTYQPLESNQLVCEALSLMEEQEVTTLPVVEPASQKVLGQISHQKLKEGQATAKLSDIELSEAIKVYENQHVFEAIRLMLQYEIPLLPIVNHEWILQGMVHKSTVLELLSSMLNLTEFGSIITIQLNQQDFSLFEIVRIIELEGAKILGITVETPDAANELFEVSVKLNLKDVTRVASALRRYDYNIKVDSTEQEYGMDVEKRADELIKYLDM